MNKIPSDSRAEGREAAIQRAEAGVPHPSPSSRATILIAGCAILFILYAGRSLISPIMTAVLISLLFKPLVRRLQRRGVSSALSSLLIVLVLLLTAAMPILTVAGYVGEWIDNAPNYIEEVETKLLALTGSAPAPEPAADDPEADATADQETEEVTNWMRSVMLVPLLAQTRNTIVTTLLILILVFFLLASGDTLMRRGLAMLPTFGEKRNIAETIFEIEQSIAGYLITLTLINTVFGLIAGTIFWALGVPNPVLWGIGAALCNFVPYVGPIVFWLILTPMCLLSFNNPMDAIWPPFVFILMNLLEGYVISPHIYGKRMSLHPLAVFLSIVIVGWLWGVLGAFIAVPLLLCISIVSKHFESLSVISNLLSGEEEPLKVGTQPAIAVGEAGQTSSDS
jgi:predicted PurR-regulated permease PerM